MDEGNSIKDMLNGTEPKDSDMRLVFGCLKILGREMQEIKELFFIKQDACDEKFAEIDKRTLKLSLKIFGIMLLGSCLFSLIIAFVPPLLAVLFK